MVDLLHYKNNLNYKIEGAQNTQNNIFYINANHV